MDDDSDTLRDIDVEMVVDSDGTLPSATVGELVKVPPAVLVALALEAELKR